MIKHFGPERIKADTDDALADEREEQASLRHEHIDDTVVVSGQRMWADDVPSPSDLAAER